MPYYAETGRSRPLISPANRLTLLIVDLVFQTFHFVLFPIIETDMMNSTRHVALIYCSRNHGTGSSFLHDR
jgi:hypothetical protein